MKRKILLATALISTLSAIEPSGYICVDKTSKALINNAVGGKGVYTNGSKFLFTEILRLKPSGRVIVYGTNNKAELIEKNNGEWQDRGDEALVIYKTDVLRNEDGKYTFIKGSKTLGFMNGSCQKMDFSKIKELYNKKAIEIQRKYNSPEEVQKRKIAAKKEYKQKVIDNAKGYTKVWNGTLKPMPKMLRGTMLNETILNGYHKLSKRMQKDIGIYLTKHNTFIQGINQTSKQVSVSDELKDTSINEADIKKYQYEIDERANIYNMYVNESMTKMGDATTKMYIQRIRNSKKRKAIIEGLTRKKIFIDGINK